jgi:hypothetical protein
MNYILHKFEAHIKAWAPHNASWRYVYFNWRRAALAELMHSLKA